MKTIKKSFLLICFALFLTGCGGKSTDSDISDDTIVYITNSGTKYHEEGCRYLKHSSIEISLTDAIDEGYDPCSVCSPPTE
ncbi:MULTISPECIES: hypothetical protein [Eubacterium]|uniref:hypothetical protein n=1 Tax=Eubacterium TaxID=1730 RepID=UPI000E4CF98A|nr:MULTISPECIES: hypothetical protein [Eubacterium]MBS5620902.1 hypothetical protein [Eubacterium sp.]RHP23596.1 hypothetical protein DWZ69_01440 [Eubacterium sp. AF34-35BH]